MCIRETGLFLVVLSVTCKSKKKKNNKSDIRRHSKCYCRMFRDGFHGSILLVKIKHSLDKIG